GDRFLGHIERCRVLIHLVDANGDDPAAAWKTVQNELRAYGAGLEDKPQILALNKTDLLDDELVAAMSDELTAAGAPVPYPLSGATGAGLEPILDQVLGYLPDTSSIEHLPARDEDGEVADWSPL
ncbi:MAG: GTPase ObgE, partial [Sphingomonadales bacterium]|nr:GTPase ObgE [Sphingomonadales bacterium]